MFTLPISSQNFKRDFLNGSGSLSAGVPAFNPLQKFDPSVTKALEISAGAAPPRLEFGQANGLACKVKFDAQAHSGVELVWPGKQTDFTQQHKIPAVSAGKLGAHLFFTASAAGNLEGSMPAGTANFEFGIKAGADVGYDRYALFDDQLAAGEILTSLIGGLRLPQHCGDPSRVPDPGELLVFGYDGFLELTAGLSWGYQLSASHNVDFNNLHAAVDYVLRLKAAVSAGYRIGGSFSIEAQRGKSAGWVRLVVRKKRDSKFDFAASFDGGVDLKTAGLPESADEFLTALLGADAKSALDLFKKIQDFTDLNKVEAEAGKLLNGTLKNLANKWIGAPLDQSTVQKFLAAAKKVADDYENADQIIVNSVMHLYEDYLGKLDVLKPALEKIAGLSSRDGLKGLSDSEAWSIINRLVGGDLFNLLKDNTLFAQTTGIAEKTLEFMNGSWQKPLKDLVDEIKPAFPLDKLMGQVAQFASKDKLLTLADTKLQGLVEKLLGRAWSEINASNAGKIAKDLNDALANVSKFKDTWSARLKEAANESFKIQANYTYTRASSDEALIDVEIDVSETAGQALYQAAAHGKFAQVLANPSSPLLEVNAGALTHKLTKSTQLHIAVLGWEFTSFHQVISNTEIAIQRGASGQIQVFTTEASLKDRREKKGRDKTTETVATNFLLRFTGEIAQSSPDGPYLTKNINNMAAQYDLSFTDEKTDEAELRNYLDLAESLQLIPSAAAFIAGLKTQFPQGFGKVTAKYIVAFDNDGVADAFKASPGTAAALAHEITQKLMRAQLLHRHLLDGPAQIALAALDPGIRGVYFKEGFTAILSRHWQVNVPDFLGGGTEQILDAWRPFIVRLLDMESDFAKRFAALDTLVSKAKREGSAIPVNDLEEDARKFVESAAEVVNYDGRINSCFAVFDALAAAGSSGKSYRESALVLEIQTAGGTKVTKYISAGTPSVGQPAEEMLAAGASPVSPGD
jgi:hypothetical protein